MSKEYIECKICENCGCLVMWRIEKYFLNVIEVLDEKEEYGDYEYDDAEYMCYVCGSEDYGGIKIRFNEKDKKRLKKAIEKENYDKVLKISREILYKNLSKGTIECCENLKKKIVKFVSEL